MSTTHLSTLQRLFSGPCSYSGIWNMQEDSVNESGNQITIQLEKWNHLESSDYNNSSLQNRCHMSPGFIRKNSSKGVVHPYLQELPCQVPEGGETVGLSDTRWDKSCKLEYMERISTLFSAPWAVHLCSSCTQLCKEPFWCELCGLVLSHHQNWHCLVGVLLDLAFWRYFALC